MSADSTTLTDPQVAAMAASAGMVEVEVIGPMRPVPAYAEIDEIPVSQTISSIPIPAVPVRIREPPRSSSTTTVNNQKRQKNGAWTVVPDRNNLKMRNTDWLPLDWVVRRKERLNGDTAGRSDHEFLAPNGIRCRSKKEVLDYTEKGILPKTTSKALRRKVSENVFETHRKKEAEEKEEDEQKEADEKLEQETPASGAEQLKGWL